MNHKFIFIPLVALFIVTHLFGLNFSYHQDEYKWVSYAHSETAVVPHPPLTEFIYTTLGHIVGDNNFRLIPFVFGLVNLFLIFYLAKIIFNRKVAIWTTFLFTISFYSILATLMVDVDGSVMPMFLLIMMIGYFKLRIQSFSLSGNYFWLILFILGAVGGFLTKMSGVLPLIALSVDFAILKDLFSDRKKIFKFIGLGFLLATGVLLILFLSKLIFPFFPIEKSITYWKHFANSSTFLDRGWLQTFIQFAKSILYTSPLLLVPVLFIDKEIWKKTRPLFLFVFVATIFYLFVFDFSLGALDRYFQFFVVPFCIIAGAVFSKYLEWSKDKEINRKTKNNIFFTVFVAILIFDLQFLPHFIPSLYPKVLWLSQFLSLKWNFLFPFTGGSGPLPFYVSFLFISITWVVCLLLYGYSLKRPLMKKMVLIAILIFGMFYNAVFLEEYLFGKINGSAEVLVKDSVARIVADKNIKKVLVYNDNGAFQIQRTGKYFRRIYAVPAYEETYKKIFEKYDGHILFIDIPRIADNSMYKKYFDSCRIVFVESNRQISSKIYDCSKNVAKTDI